QPLILEPGQMRSHIRRGCLRGIGRPVLTKVLEVCRQIGRVGVHGEAGQASFRMQIGNEKIEKAVHGTKDSLAGGPDPSDYSPFSLPSCGVSSEAARAARLPSSISFLTFCPPLRPIIS